MLKKLFVLITLTLFTAAAFAQSLYTPRDVTKAYQKGTRDISGKPGPNYWQNHGKYNIHVMASRL